MCGEEVISSFFLGILQRRRVWAVGGEGSVGQVGSRDLVIQLFFQNIGSSQYFVFFFKEFSFRIRVGWLRFFSFFVFIWQRCVYRVVSRVFVFSYGSQLRIRGCSQLVVFFEYFLVSEYVGKVEGVEDRGIFDLCI